MLVAQRWFVREELGQGVSLICEPHVHPFFRCNIWLVRGRDCDLLVDSGMGLRPLAPALDLTPGKPVVAVATHAHVDHIGGLHEFVDRRAHHCEASAYEAMPDEVTLAHLFREVETPVDALPCEGWRATDYRLEPAPIRATLDEGAQIDLGDRRLTVISLPGHSPGCVGLFDSAEGVLFTGDALYDGELVDDFPQSSPPAYERTMARLRELDIRIGHGGHGPSFDNARKNRLVDDYLAGRRRQGCPTGSPG